MISIRNRLLVLCTIGGCTDLPDFDDPRALEAETAADNCDDLLVNGDFDDGAVGWNASPSSIIHDDTDVAPTIFADSGSHFAWLGGDFSVTRSIAQEIQVPSSTTQLRLRGKYSIATASESGQVEDTLEIELYNSAGTLLSTPLTLTNNTWTIGGDDFFKWSPLDVTIGTTAVTGQRARLRLVSINDSENNTNFLFDSLALRSSGCP